MNVEIYTWTAEDKERLGRAMQEIFEHNIKQEKLGEKFEDVLYDNLWDLYAD